jgi:nucleotide-binding universal stress UspA family protein
MDPAAEPVLVAYDGSEVSKAALSQAAGLIGERVVVLATIWEPGLATLPVAFSGDAMDTVSLPPDPRTVEAVDHAQHDHAERVVQEGAELARSLGLTVEARAVPDDLDVADTLIQLADERGAAAIVVGSHGVSGFRSHMLGSVARKLIEHSARPVLVVRGQGRE